MHSGQREEQKRRETSNSKLNNNSVSYGGGGDSMAVHPNISADYLDNTVHFEDPPKKLKRITIPNAHFVPN